MPNTFEAYTSSLIVSWVCSKSENKDPEFREKTKKEAVLLDKIVATLGKSYKILLQRIATKAKPKLEECRLKTLDEDIEWLSLPDSEYFEFNFDVDIKDTYYEFDKASNQEKKVDADKFITNATKFLNMNRKSFAHIIMLDLVECIKDGKYLPMIAIDNISNNNLTITFTIQNMH